MDRHGFGKCGRRRFEYRHRGALGGAAGERVDDGEGASGGRCVDLREPRGGLGTQLASLVVVVLNRVTRARRKRGQEFEGQAQVGYKGAEFGAVRAVPRDDRIEAPEPVDDVLGGKQAEPVKPGRNNGLRGIGEAGERERSVRRTRPQWNRREELRALAGSL